MIKLKKNVHAPLGRVKIWWIIFVGEYQQKVSLCCTNTDTSLPITLSENCPDALEAKLYNY